MRAYKDLKPPQIKIVDIMSFIIVLELQFKPIKNIKQVIKNERTVSVISLMTIGMISIKVFTYVQ